MTRAEQEARRLREEVGGLDLPVDVEGMARRVGVILVVETLGRDVSGLLVRRGEDYAIGVNAAHPMVRQRFTIAHELGHLRLHPGRPLILDHVRVSMRNDLSSQGTEREEREANAFAAELLMPREAVMENVRRILDRGQTPDKKFVPDLALLFDVSEQAMEVRLVNLGLRRQI